MQHSVRTDFGAAGQKEIASPSHPRRTSCRHKTGMAIIYISDADGQQSQHSEHEARLRWDDGRISRNALYWRHGMPDWRPATEYFEGIAPPEPPPIPEMPSVVRTFVKDPAALTRFVVFMLWVYLASSVVAGLISSYSLATGQTSLPETDELSPFQMIEALFGLLQLTILLTTSIGFLRWIYRAHVNVRALGASGLKYSPGWSVGWFFVPILNLWKPLAAMKELWQASSNPDAWQNEQPATIVNTWWTLWLLSNFLGQLSLRLSLGGDGSNAVNSELCSILSNVFDIPLSLVAIRLLNSILEMQTRWVTR